MSVLNENLVRHPAVETGLASPEMPGPREGERPAVFADRIGEWYAARRSVQQRKDHGLFLTQVPTADFMAGRIMAGGRKVRILDPAAGAGILCCAAVEALVSRCLKPDTIELVAYEVDRDLITPLWAVLEYLADWCGGHRVALAVRIEATDFIMANAGALRGCELLPARAAEEKFDAVIANPPYFKIGKADPRAAAVSQRGPRSAEHLRPIYGGWCRIAS